MKRILFIIFFLVIANSKGICENSIFFNFDYCIFEGEGGKSILEIYYSVNQHSLLYTKTGNGFEGGALVSISLTEISGGRIVYSNDFKSPSIVQDTSKDKNVQKLIGQVNYLLENGNYKLSVIGSDYNDSTKQDIFEQEISISNNNSGNISVSDIEFSTSIQKSQDTKSPYYKNTLEIIPNPSALFGMNLNELYYYLEIYGLTSNNISDEYTIKYLVNDLNNVNLITYNKLVKRKNESKADYGKIKIDSLQRGSYFFKVLIIDSIKNVSISREKKFFIYNNLNTVVTSTSQNDFLRSEYAAMSEDDLTDEFRKTLYIMKPDLEKRYKDLSTLEEKRKFMYEFWKFYDINPVTQMLETKVAYMKRVKEANKSYKEPYMDGWRTDRGRIYIIYGKPDDVERYPFESQTKSYEIWKYDAIEGGGECAFIENQQSSGVYVLVHSSFRNELKNQNWKEQIEIR